VKRSTVVLFDLGGVLVETGVFSALTSLMPEPLDGEPLRERWLRSQAVRSFELGRISPMAFARRFVEEWELQLAAEAFLDRFCTWIWGPYPGAEDLVTALRDWHHVSCLTNCNEVHWSELAPFLSHFDSAFSSHLLGEIKPDQKAFEVVMRELAASPERVYFLDDSRLNIEAAQRLGIRAFRVEGIAAARQVLDSEGLL
jgi:glucose-1-phosphatase